MTFIDSIKTKCKDQHCWRTEDWCNLLNIEDKEFNDEEIKKNRKSPSFSNVSISRNSLIKSGFTLSLLYDDVKRASSSFKRLEQYHHHYESPSMSNCVGASLTMQELQQRIIHSIMTICQQYQVDYLQGLLHIAITIAFLIPCPLHKPSLFTHLLHRFLNVTCPQFFLSQSESIDCCHYQKHLCLLFHQLLQFHFPSIIFRLDRLYLSCYWNIDWFDALCSTNFHHPFSLLNFWFYIIQSTQHKWALCYRNFSSPLLSDPLLSASALLSSSSIAEVNNTSVSNQSDNGVPIANPLTSLHVSTTPHVTDPILSIYPEYMIMLLAIIDQMRKQQMLLHQRSLDKQKESPSLKEVWDSIDQLITTQLCSKDESSGYTFWDLFFGCESEQDSNQSSSFESCATNCSTSAFSPTVVLSCAVSASETTNQFSFLSPMNDIRQGWIYQLKESYNILYHKTPTCWFKLVHKVMNYWKISNIETLRKTKKKEMDNFIAMNLFRSYSLRISQNELLSLIKENLIVNGVEEQLAKIGEEGELTTSASALGTTTSGEFDTFDNKGMKPGMKYQLQSFAADDRLQLRNNEDHFSQLVDNSKSEEQYIFNLVIIISCSGSGLVTNDVTEFSNQLIRHSAGSEIFQQLINLNYLNGITIFFITEHSINNANSVLPSESNIRILSINELIPALNSIIEQIAQTFVIIIDEDSNESNLRNDCINHQYLVLDGVIQSSSHEHLSTLSVAHKCFQNGIPRELSNTFSD